MTAPDPPQLPDSGPAEVASEPERVISVGPAGALGAVLLALALLRRSRRLALLGAALAALELAPPYRTWKAALAERLGAGR